MMDYVYFLGMAVFVASISIPGLARIRVSVMTGCLAFSVMWTAIEKFVYPQWTQQILEKHSNLAMGFHFSLFIVIAGFVEFTLAFYLGTGRGLLRLGALALLFVFISAMPEFGRRDVVGHIPLVAILAIPFVAGDSGLQRLWRMEDRASFSMRHSHASSTRLLLRSSSCFITACNGRSIRMLPGDRADQ